MGKHTSMIVSFSRSMCCTLRQARDKQRPNKTCDLMYHFLNKKAHTHTSINTKTQKEGVLIHKIKFNLLTKQKSISSSSILKSIY